MTAKVCILNENIERAWGKRTSPFKKIYITKEEINMVKIYASEKGEGKTKLLIDMANKAVGECGGDVVYIDDDKRPIFDLKHEIRFVEVKEFPLENYRE